MTNVTLVHYLNNDGENRVIGVWDSIVTGQHVALKRVAKFQKEDDSVRFKRKRKGNTITVVVFHWDEAEGKPTWHDAELCEVERYVITQTKVKHTC